MAKFAFNVPEVRILVEAKDADDAMCKLWEIPGFHVDASLDDPDAPAFLIRGFGGEIEQQLRTCAACGCTDDDACEQGCSWKTANLCDTDDDAHARYDGGKPDA